MMNTKLFFVLTMSICLGHFLHSLVDFYKVATDTGGDVDATRNSNGEVADQDHPWWWIGLQNQLDAKDVTTVTDIISRFAASESILQHYDTPQEFVKACNDGKLLQGKCDFLGGPTELFGTMGPHVLHVLKKLGMRPTSNVLEVGSGLGRVSTSLIRFLDRDKFCGIEPNGDMLAVGVTYMVGKQLLEEKRPRYSTSINFEFDGFIKKFDVVTSRSVWTHASKGQIEHYLEAFLHGTTPNAFLLTSVTRVTDDCSKDYNGTEWVGKSDSSNSEGVVIHCMPWLRQACDKFGLRVKPLKWISSGWEEDLGQPWLVIWKNEGVAPHWHA